MAFTNTAQPASVFFANFCFHFQFPWTFYLRTFILLFVLETHWQLIKLDQTKCYQTKKHHYQIIFGDFWVCKISWRWNTFSMPGLWQKIQKSTEQPGKSILSMFTQKGNLLKVGKYWKQNIKFFHPPKNQQKDLGQKMPQGKVRDLFIKSWIWVLKMVPSMLNLTNFFLNGNNIIILEIALNAISRTARSLPCSQKYFLSHNTAELGWIGCNLGVLATST